MGVRHHIHLWAMNADWPISDLFFTRSIDLTIFHWTMCFLHSSLVQPRETKYVHTFNMHDYVHNLSQLAVYISHLSTGRKTGWRPDTHFTSSQLPQTHWRAPSTPHPSSLYSPPLTPTPILKRSQMHLPTCELDGVRLLVWARRWALDCVSSMVCAWWWEQNDMRLMVWDRRLALDGVS